MGRRKQAEERVNDMESRKTLCAYQIEYLPEPSRKTWGKLIVSP